MAEIAEINVVAAPPKKTTTPATRQIIPLEQRTDVTADELEKTPLLYPAELYDGKVVFKIASPERTTMQSNISTALKSYLRHNRIGHVTSKTGFQLWPNRPTELRLPDVAYITKERAPEASQRFLPIAPELAVEIISPQDKFCAVMSKVDEYLKQGARTVWLITPPRFREVWVFTIAGMHSVRDILTAPELLPGFELPVSKIFDGLPLPEKS
jgi:Uma2 family endonuclease